MTLPTAFFMVGAVLATAGWFATFVQFCRPPRTTPAWVPALAAASFLGACAAFLASILTSAAGQ